MTAKELTAKKLDDALDKIDLIRGDMANLQETTASARRMFELAEREYDRTDRAVSRLLKDVQELLGMWPVFRGVARKLASDEAELLDSIKYLDSDQEQS